MLAPTFLVYRTSAGAGKTHTLVKEYLKHALPNEKFDSTIAITFTNKAANEMKERILEYLYKTANKDLDSAAIKNLIDEIKQETKLEEEKIIEKSNNLLNEILHNYSKFAISTIDSFIHDIIRTFSKDLNIPVNFNVELDSEEIIDYVIAELLSQINTKNDESKKLTEYIIQFALTNFEEGKSWNIQYSLAKFSNLVFEECFNRYGKSTSKISITEYQDMLKNVKKTKYEIKTNIQNLASEALAVFSKNNITPDDLYQKDRGIYGYFMKLKSNVNHDNLNPNTYVLQAIEEDKWQPKNFNTEISEDAKQKIIDIYNQITTNVLSKNIELIENIEKSIMPMALIGHISKNIEDYYNENDVLHISVFNQLISDIIIKEPVPYIYERIGQKYNRYLIDEFQDTSSMQWKNFLPLVGNTLSENNGFSLVVGDVKQAIYRFRNSEMEQLMVLPGIYDKPDGAPHFTDIENQLKNSFKEIDTSLPERNINYRSGQYIVEFNNKLFEWICNEYKNTGANKFIADAYKTVRQEYSKHNKDSGFVKIFQINDEDNYEQLTNETIYNIISDYYKKNNNYNDIAILVRFNKNAKEISKYLMNHKQPIPVISDESLELSFSPEVCFIVDILKILKNNHNKIAVFSAYSYLFNSNKISDARHKNLNSELIELFLSEESPYTIFTSILAKNNYHINWKTLITKPLNDIVSEIIALFGFNKTVNTYIIFLQDAVFEFSSTHGNSLMEFIEWWDEKGKNKSIVIPEGADAVRIMSIHKSKGLQFKTVIYPYVHYDIKDNRGIKKWIDISLLPEELKQKLNFNSNLKYIYLQINQKIADSNAHIKAIHNNETLKAELDSINMHYVAMTRAEENLYVITKIPESDKNFANIADITNKFISYDSGDKNSILNKDLTESETIKAFSFGKLQSTKSTKREPQTFTLTNNIYNPQHNLKLAIQKLK